MRRLALLATVFLVACAATRALADSAVPAPAIASTLAQVAAMFPGTTAMMLIALASFAASLVCAVTPTPAPTSPWRGLYELLECIAVVTRTTKLTGIPAIDALHNATSALLEARKADPPPAASQAQKP